MRIVLVFLATVWLCSAARAQIQHTFTRVELLLPEPSRGRFMAAAAYDRGGVVTIVSNRAYKVWLVMSGVAVAYASDSGVGGFENEGQSLHLYTAASGKTRGVLAEYYMIDSVWSVHLTNKKWALLVAMSDGGLGAKRIAVVDPARGEVFFRNLCRVRKVAGDFVTLDFYTADDWGRIVEGSERESKGVKPSRIENVDLKKALAGKVVVNKRAPTY